MGLFTLRDTGGGSALRDPTSLDTLRDGAATTTLYEALSDTLALNQVATGRQAMVALVANALVFSDGTGGGTAYTVTVTNALILADANTTTPGGGIQNYTQASVNLLTLVTTSADYLNLGVIPLVPSRPDWGESQEWNAWVEFLVAGTVAASSATGEFRLVGGRITEDVSRSVMGDVSLDLAFPEGSSLIPVEVGDLLTPHGDTVIRVWAGYKNAEVCMGYYDLATTPLTVDLGGLRVAVTGMSFERVIQRAGFWGVDTWDNLQAVDGIVRLVNGVLGGNVQYVLPPFDVPIPGVSFKPGDDRLAMATKMAQAAGLEFRFARTGQFVVSGIPSPDSYLTAPAQWEFLDGPSGTLVSAVRDFDDEDSYNGVVLEGAAPRDSNSQPVYAAAFITDPSSPLRFNPSLGAGSSRWGPRPKYVRNEFVGTAEQASSVLANELTKLSAVSDTITVKAAANAGVEVGNYARLRASKLGVDAVFRVNRIVHDLTGGAMEATLGRAKRV